MKSLSAMLALERDRWALWIPVFLGTGIAVYFALPAEPPLWLGISSATAFIGLGLAVRRRPAILLLMVALGVVSGGFTVAQWRSALVAAPMLSERLGPTSVTGRIIAVETFPNGHRVTLERLRIARLGPERTPETVRIRMRGKQPQLNPGDWIRLRAKLAPPSAPAAPGAFDFQRQSYFKQLGAVGFAYGSATVVSASSSEGADAIWLGIEKVRQRITEKVWAGLPGPSGTMAAALMTGKRKAIPPEIMTAVRESGLAHLLAISGLHIGLVTGILFIGMRRALALAPPLALRFPIKKWAAFFAISGAFAYAMVAGATVPTQRAFLMVGLVLLAVLLDRRGLSMRMVAWAATVVLLVQPESILGASFQMSFAAVAALIASYEALRNRRWLVGGETSSWLHKMLRYWAGVALSTLIAASATAPFALYNFNQISAYGLAANLIAVPLTAMWIMPFAVVAFVLMPLGLETLALTPMGWGIEIVIRVAETVSTWPGAISVVPSMPTWSLAVITLGGVWLCLWQRRWRLWGGAVIVAGMVAMAFVTPPDILIDGKGTLLAVRTAEGKLAVSSLRKAKFNRAIWQRRDGMDNEATLWPAAGFSPDGRLSCDHMGCIYRIGGRVVALVRHPGALSEDCRIAEVIVSTVPVRMKCPSAKIVIDRFDLWRQGGHALWLEKDAIRVESVNEIRGRRPWVPAPKARKGGL